VTDRLFKVSEVAKAYNCSPDTVRKLIRSGDLPAVPVGSSYRVRESDLEAYATPVVPAVMKAEAAAAVDRVLAKWQTRVDRDLAHIQQQINELRHETYPRAAA
jgi:excisionase family DNA binding protein